MKQLKTGALLALFEQHDLSETSKSKSMIAAVTHKSTGEKRYTPIGTWDEG